MGREQVRILVLNYLRSTVKRLLNPSVRARFQMETYNPDNPLDKIPLGNFIFQQWKNTWDR
ncbi:hypothetical protein LV83_03305 [Algoriphagus yeomjeoni]|uniref:Uncharacterized protein n=1 Tax=Algoriphagus yeomjeoni TaxID=291403 RepID=A0A327P3C8_9BACT|nr:hypothetical protein LV83_03305 [Algoriphagus yeomjeoni]